MLMPALDKPIASRAASGHLVESASSTCGWAAVKISLWEQGLIFQEHRRALPPFGQICLLELTPKALRIILLQFYRISVRCAVPQSVASCGVFSARVGDPKLFLRKRKNAMNPAAP